MITKNIAPIEDVLGSLSQFNLNHDEIESCTVGYYRILNILERYIPENHENRKIEVYLGVFNTWGSQSICDISVSDKSLPFRESYNWHLQNTSQWLFAGGWVFDVNYRDFSLHT